MLFRGADDISYLIEPSSIAFSFGNQSIGFMFTVIYIYTVLRVWVKKNNQPSFCRMNNYLD